MDYLYSRVEQASFATNTPLRRAFSRHLFKISKALHDIEWVDSGDCSVGSEEDAIKECITKSDILEQATQDARAALKDLKEALGEI